MSDKFKKTQVMCCNIVLVWFIVIMILVRICGWNQVINWDCVLEDCIVLCCC